jgi:hypothetical protein
MYTEHLVRYVSVCVVTSVCLLRQFMHLAIVSGMIPISSVFIIMPLLNCRLYLNLGCLHPVACEIKVRVFSVYAMLIS